MLGGIPDLLRRAFSFYENLFPKEEPSSEGIIEDENGNKLDTNRNRKQPGNANLRLAVHVRVLTHLVLMSPSLAAVGYYFVVNREIERQVASEKKTVDGLEKKLTAAQNTVAEAEQHGIEKSYLMMSNEEVKSLISTFSWVKGEIEKSKYWPSPDQTDKGRKQAMKEIASQLANIEMHLGQAMTFNTWLDGILPKNLHSSTVEALDVFKNRCLPQMKSASPQTDLTALKGEVLRAHKDLIESLKQVADRRGTGAPFVKK